jgi:hypothetical protein
MAPVIAPIDRAFAASILRDCLRRFVDERNFLVWSGFAQLRAAKRPVFSSFLRRLEEFSWRSRRIGSKLKLITVQHRLYQCFPTW